MLSSKELERKKEERLFKSQFFQICSDAWSGKAQEYYLFYTVIYKHLYNDSDMKSFFNGMSRNDV